jgi:hypothetical protein
MLTLAHVAREELRQLAWLSLLIELFFHLSLQADSNMDLMLRALGGEVVFETARCERIDMCELAEKVDAVLEKFVGD